MNRKRSVLLIVGLSFFFTAILLHCVKIDESDEIIGTTKTTVLTANYETDAVSAAKDDDAADDPAIWINYEDPSRSLVVGTNKKAGLNLYNLQGEEVFFIAEGLINNVDVRYDFDLNGEMVDITGASNRSNNTIVLHIIDGVNQELIPAHAREIESGVDEVYGFCLYRSK
jgi:3-phytase